MLFCTHYQSGLPPPNPDARNFSRKVSCESSKASPKIKWCVRWEILLHTFLIRKVGSLAHLSTKERCVYNIFLHKNTSASETYNCNFSFNGKIRIYFRTAQKHFFQVICAKYQNSKEIKNFTKIHQSAFYTKTSGAFFLFCHFPSMFFNLFLTIQEQKNFYSKTPLIYTFFIV